VVEVGGDSSHCLHLLLVAKNCGSVACVTSLTGQAGIFNCGKVLMVVVRVKEGKLHSNLHIQCEGDLRQTEPTKD
jgi:hypothetical protein